MPEKFELKTFIKEQGKEHHGDSITIDGSLQQLFNYLNGIGWEEFENGFVRDKIEHVIFTTAGAPFKLTMKISREEAARRS